MLHGDLYTPVRDPGLFGQVGIDPDAHTLVWPNGTDFDPATLRDWPLVADRFAAMARAWRTDVVDPAEPLSGQ